MGIGALKGIRVGHARDGAAPTGVSVVLFDAPAVAGVAVHGGAPGTRETDALSPHGLAPPVDAIALAGGSAFGLTAADGAQRALHAMGRGFPVGSHRVPIVPAAIIFDLAGRPAATVDYAALGEAAVAAASASDSSVAIEEGSVGAGVNATTAHFMGGIGTASEPAGPFTVAALVVVNAFGSATAANGPWLRAAPFARDGEMGATAAPAHADFATVVTKASDLRGATTIAVVATNARLDGAQATRLAMTAHDGFALSLWPAHTLFDGDTIFAAATAERDEPVGPMEITALGTAAIRAVARSVGRAMVAARGWPGAPKPLWRDAAGALT